MVEYPQHRRYKERTYRVLVVHPDFQNVRMEHNTGVYVPTTTGPKPLTADVYAELVNPDGTIQKIAVEIDGKVGHSQRKDERRDRTLKEAGIITVRFPVKWFAGKKGMTDDQIVDQIKWKAESDKPMEVVAH